MEPREAVQVLHKRLRRIAKCLSGDDRDLRDDLCQEMALAILECEGKAHTRSFYGRVAINRAKDYLKWLDVRADSQPLEDVKEEPVFEPKCRRFPKRYVDYLERQGIDTTLALGEAA
jgi:DNA-directed RNA polymerase specialized sigma24 family protein